jgi:hypothetical protein
VTLTRFMLTIEKCEWLLAQAVRIYVRAEDVANKAQLATLFGYRAAVHARVNELHRRAVYPDTRTRRKPDGSGGWSASERTLRMYALESGFGYVIADMFRKILNAEAPWNDDTKERMATARTALHTYVMHKFGHRMPLTPTAGYPWLRKAETAERNQKPGTNEVAGPTPPRPESDPVLHRPPKTGTILDESIAALTDLGFFDGLALVAQDEGDEGDFQVFRGVGRSE